MTATATASDLKEAPKPNPCVAKNWKRVNHDFESFKGRDLRGLTISNMSLKGASFEDADLTGAKMVNVDLTWVNLKGAKGSGMILADACVHQADLSGFVAPNSAWENVLVSYSKIDKLNVVGAQLVESAFVKSKGRIIANGGSWHDMALTSNILTGSSLVNTFINDMPNVKDNDLSNINVQGAKFLEVTILPGNNLTGVNFGKLAVRNRLVLPVDK